MKTTKIIPEKEKKQYQRLFLLLFETCLFFENSYHVEFHEKAEYNRSFILASRFLYKLLNVGVATNYRNKTFSLEVISTSIIDCLKDEIYQIFCKEAEIKSAKHSLGKKYVSEKAYKNDVKGISDFFGRFSSITDFPSGIWISNKFRRIKPDIVINSFVVVFTYHILNFGNRKEAEMRLIQRKDLHISNDDFSYNDKENQETFISLVLKMIKFIPRTSIIFEKYKITSIKSLRNSFLKLNDKDKKQFKEEIKKYLLA